LIKRIMLLVAVAAVMVLTLSGLAFAQGCADFGEGISNFARDDEGQPGQHVGVGFNPPFLGVDGSVHEAQDAVCE
jgi:hypothetical protein